MGTLAFPFSLPEEPGRSGLVTRVASLSGHRLEPEMLRKQARPCRSPFVKQGKGLFREAEALGVDAQKPWGKEGHALTPCVVCRRKRVAGSV